MESVIVTEVMSREEAEQLTAECRYHAAKLRQHIAAIYERRGYMALGYDTFEAWAEAELQTGYKWALKMRNAHLVQRELEAVLAPQGEAVELPTKHAEQLGKLDSAVDKATAYRRAQSLAAAEGKAAPATRHVQQAVAVVQDEQAVRGGNYPILTHYMDSGTLTPRTAFEIMQALGKLTPVRQVFVVGIIGRHPVSDVGLVVRLAGLYDRQDSPLLGEIRTGYLNSRPLIQATVEDWNAAAEEIRRVDVAAWADAQREQQQVEAVILTLHKTRNGGDVVAAAAYNLRVLVSELRKEDLDALRILLNERIA